MQWLLLCYKFSWAGQLVSFLEILKKLVKESKERIASQAQFVVVVDVLRDALLKQITELNENESESQRIVKFNEMLDKSFPVIHNEKLQPIAMHIMKYIPKIKPKYLAAVSW